MLLRDILCPICVPGLHTGGLLSKGWIHFELALKDLPDLPQVQAAALWLMHNRRWSPSHFHLEGLANVFNHLFWQQFHLLWVKIKASNLEPQFLFWAGGGYLEASPRVVEPSSGLTWGPRGVQSGGPRWGGVQEKLASVG